MKQTILTHPATSAFGLTILCCLALLGPLVNTDHLAAYHTSLPLTSVLLTVLVEILLAFLAWFTLLRLSLLKPRLWAFTWIAILLMIPWIVLKQGAIVGLWIISSRANHIVLYASVAAFLTAWLLWNPAFLPRFAKLQHFAATLLGFQAIYGLLLLARLGLALTQAHLLAVTPPLQPTPLATVRQPHQKVLWIVLDELSYDQVYEHRLPGLALPAFDLLAAQSTLFTHVVPAGSSTELVLPALITGTSVDAIHASADSQHLALHSPSPRAWHPFDQFDTIFQDARNQGFATSVVGWYNPYCRILPRVLDHCTWVSRPLQIGDISAGNSVATNLLAVATSFGRSFKQLLHPNRTAFDPGEAIHLDDFRDLTTATDQALRDPSATMLLTHMPIPHPLGIYSRATGEFASPTTPTSYIDNLALADRFLAHLRQLLVDQDDWNNATIVIMGDHSWRTFIWRATPQWSPEDELASHHGRFDPRPAYIVKLPGQTQPALIDTPFPALRTRELLQNIFDGKIESVSDLRTFATAGRAP